MSEQQRGTEPEAVLGPEDLLVSTGAERVLADRASLGADTTSPEQPKRGSLGRRAYDNEPPAEASAEIAVLSSELAAVQSELSTVSAGVISLQSARLRLMGVAALVLAVLVAVGWKAMGG